MIANSTFRPIQGHYGTSDAAQKKARSIIVAFMICMLHVGAGIVMYNATSVQLRGVVAASQLVTVSLLSPYVPILPSTKPISPQSVQSISPISFRTSPAIVATIPATSIDAASPVVASTAAHATTTVSSSLIERSALLSELPQQVSAPVFSPPRFDAQYLNNPAPAYPLLSKRLGEQGVVMLRVMVSALGLAERVEIHMSSGIDRLDTAAVAAVRQWRFIPAMQGDAATTGIAIIPINFQLS